ncbi:MAG: hypothetical protein AUJ56_08000 [Zetaproteobacteria bacterium CG1_02_49_23]|nr:MAG: hypothetical protein AUJ56_08000 [Zetaproteobacteria bacterium CG1_02_49_23]
MENKMQIGFFGLLGILFIALKLTGVIDWSWWMVTMPLWFGAVVFVAVFIFYWIIYSINRWATKK